MFFFARISMKSGTAKARTISSEVLKGSREAAAWRFSFSPTAGGKAVTAITMTMEAMSPVATKITSIQPRIRPRRLMSGIPATAEEMEKKTTGTVAVKRRLMKISPKGLKRTASFLKTTPSTAPMSIDRRSRIENP